MPKKTEKELLTELAMAVDDYKVGYEHPHFAAQHGGVEGLRKDMFEAHDAWEVAHNLENGDAEGN